MNDTIISSSNLILYLLNNLNTTESAILDRYLCEKNYASLKVMIDRKRAELFKTKDKALKSVVDNAQKAPGNFAADINELTAALSLNLTQEQFKYAEAYRNATIYSVICALWNTKVEQELPQIDQYAILEYYSEKLAQKEAEENILIWLWNIIRKLFDRENDKFECYANEPKCVRAVLDRCGETELEHLQQATDNNESKLINDFIKKKLDDSEMFVEYDKWNNANDVPGALKEIIHSLSQAQRRAMEKLRRLELTDKIKDFYRENIEKTSLPKQQEIELFFRRMNMTFAGCYKPNIKKTKERQVFFLKPQNSHLKSLEQQHKRGFPDVSCAERFSGAKLLISVFLRSFFAATLRI
ncbi:unnamed protein product [Brugia timori]|uniref:Uncharacterized protein n=1 Tax=Brugia timori TaxID=42155 RepID=A0A3P7UDL0_9BILA|nr:unnamed protein product [Brugia timori]